MNSHYFDASPTTSSQRATVPLVLPDVTLTLATDRSVFSRTRVDPGTRYLLQDVPPPAPGARHGLDLGCGYGPVAVVMARRAPALTVWAVDVNERAVALTAENAAASGGEGVHAVLVSDAEPFGSIPDDVRFDVIWSNPPVRIGKHELHALLARWLGRLSPDGVAHLVVQKHLGSDSLQQWLDAHGWPTTRRGSRAGYRLLEVRAAGSAPTAPTAPPDTAPTPPDGAR